MYTQKKNKNGKLLKKINKQKKIKNALDSL